MQISWNSNYIGHVGFNIETDDYDGEPNHSSFWFDAAPKKIHADREAVAAFLVFGAFMGGLVKVPHKFSPAVDSAMRGILSPVPVVFTPVEYYPKALPEGERFLSLSWSGSAEESELQVDPNSAYLRIERSDQMSGSLRSLSGLTLGSNAWLHSRGLKDSLSSIRPFLAAAVLFAEDLDAGTIVVTGDFDSTSDDWIQLQYLLGTARLGLELRTPKRS